MIDPILPLSISIAEGRGTYCFFLGSGISKSASIPTGDEIFWDSIHFIYKIINEKDGKKKEIEDWFKSSELVNYNYSRILETIALSKEDRRKYLEKYFVGKEPTNSHRTIAKLIKKGLVKVIITTNFDRLMEKSLEDEKVPFDVVASEQDFENIRPREQSSCRILKIHGDYQYLNIKNTDEELKNLDEQIDREFQEIIDRYGIIVIGYSGSDDGVMKCFKKRNSKYSLYWVSNGDVLEQVKELIRRQDGRIIIRSNADTFLEELTRKISIHHEYPTGENPIYIINSVKKFLKDNDRIELLDEIKKQQEECIKYWFKIFDQFNVIHTIGLEEAYDLSQKGLKAFEIISDKIAAIGLVLINFDEKDYFKELLKTIEIFYNLPSMLKKGKNQFSYVIPLYNVPYVATYSTINYWGSFAIKKENINIINLLLKFRILDENNDYSSILSLYEYLYCETFDNRNKQFEFLLSTVKYKDYLKEFFHEYEFQSLAKQFNFLLTLISLKNEPQNIISPVFSAFRNNEDIIPLLAKLRVKTIFSDSLTENIFNESYESFISTYKEKIELLNKTFKLRRPLDPEYFLK